MYLPHEQNDIINITVQMLLYVQEVVTLQKKIFNISASAFINYYDTLSWILFVYRAK